MDKKKEKNPRAMSRADYKLRPSRVTEIFCGILAAITALVVWLLSAPI